MNRTVGRHREVKDRDEDGGENENRHDDGGAPIEAAQEQIADHASVLAAADLPSRTSVAMLGTQPSPCGRAETGVSRVSGRGRGPCLTRSVEKANSPARQDHAESHDPRGVPQHSGAN